MGSAAFLIVKAIERMSDNCILHFGWEIHMIVSRGSLYGYCYTITEKAMDTQKLR